MQRKTAQREAIRNAFADAERPLSPAEILEAAQARLPGIGIATVYRNVKELVAKGCLQTVQVPGEIRRYEQVNKAHHHHFTCRVCGRVFDFEGCPGRIDDLAPKGFETEDHEIFLFGRCRDCVRQSRVQLCS